MPSFVETKNSDKGLPDFWKIEKLRLEKSNQSNTMQNIPFGISKKRTPITHKKMSVEHSFLSVEHSMKNDLKKGFYFFHFQIVAKKNLKIENHRTFYENLEENRINSK